MSNLSRLLLFVLLVVLAGGAIFLATWEIPSPSTPVEKVIPNDRIFR